MSTSALRELRAPRVPAGPPVIVSHIRTVKLHGGAHYAAHAYVVTDPTGDLVEVISGDDSTEQTVFARWPWFSTHKAPRFGITRQAWPAITVDVAPKEYDRITGMEPWSDTARKLRELGDRCQRYNAVRDALNEVGMYTDREHPAVIYHRDRKHGGDHVSDHVRRAFARFVAAGIVRRVDSDPPNLRGVCAQYRATDRTPAYS